MNDTPLLAPPAAGLATVEPYQGDTAGFPPILAGRATPTIHEKVHRFYASVADIFEAWVTRRQSPHTQRAYRRDILSLVEFLGLKWPGGRPIACSPSRSAGVGSMGLGLVSLGRPLPHGRGSDRGGSD